MASGNQLVGFGFSIKPDVLHINAVAIARDRECVSRGELQRRLGEHRSADGKETFKTTPDGVPGNDDLGATSGVYVWNALGLYPAVPGVGALVTPKSP